MSTAGYCSARDSIKKVLEVSKTVGVVDEQVLRRFVKVNVQGADLNTWVYMGPSGDYVIVPGVFCSCSDFTIRVVGRREKCYCKHLVDQALSEKRGLYRVVDLGSFDEYIKVLNEVFTQNLTSTLRKKLYTR